MKSIENAYNVNYIDFKKLVNQKTVPNDELEAGQSLRTPTDSCFSYMRLLSWFSRAKN